MAVDMRGDAIARLVDEDDSSDIVEQESSLNKEIMDMAKRFNTLVEDAKAVPNLVADVGIFDKLKFDVENMIAVNMSREDIEERERLMM